MMVLITVCLKIPIAHTWGGVSNCVQGSSVWINCVQGSSELYNLEMKGKQMR